MKKLIFALLLGLLSVALPVSAYVVKPGDTLSGLYGSNWRTVAQQNGITDPRKLQIGTVLPEPSNQRLVGQMLGSAIPTSPALVDTYLASGIAPGDTSMTLANGTTRAGTTLSGYMCFTIDVNTPVVEYVCGTASGTAVTGMMRGIDLTNPNVTSSALAFSHRRFASVQISDYPLLTLLARMLNGVDSIPGKLQLDLIPVVATTTPTLPGDLVPLSFLTTVTTTGCANASTAVRGCVQTTDDNGAKASSVTNLGSTGAQLVIPPVTFQNEADHHYINEYAYGESIFQSYPVLYMSSSGKWFQAHGNVQAEIDRIGAVGYVGTSNTTTPLPVYGFGSHIAGTNLSGLTPGQLIYLGNDARGSATPGTIRKVVGRAVKSDSWLFNPDLETPTSTPGPTNTPLMTNSSGYLPTNIIATTTVPRQVLRNFAAGSNWDTLKTFSNFFTFTGSGVLTSTIGFEPRTIKFDCGGQSGSGSWNTSLTNGYWTASGTQHTSGVSGTSGSNAQDEFTNAIVGAVKGGGGASYNTLTVAVTATSTSGFTVTASQTNGPTTISCIYTAFEF